MSDATLAVGAPSTVSPGTIAIAGIPMPEAQEGLWYAQRLDPDNPSFNTAQYVDIRGALDVDAFRAAVRAAMEESGALRVQVRDTADGPLLIADQANHVVLEVVDLASEPDPEAAALRLMERDQQTPIDPGRGRLVAQRLFILAGDRWFWYQRIHHLVIDGYGTSLLTARICELYAAHTVPGAATGTPLVPFAAVVAADAAYRNSDRRQADREFWLNEFADRPVAPRLVEEPPNAAHTSHSHSVGLPAAVAESVVALASGAKATWPDALVALCAAYVSRHTRSSEPVIGVPSMNRLGTPAARVPSMVMNVLPLRVPVNEDAPLAELVAEVARRQRLARRHGRYRGEQVRRDLGLTGSDRWLHGPLVNVLPFDAPLSLPGASATLHTLCTGPVDDLTITLRGDGSGSGLRLELEANPDLYSRSDTVAHAERLAHFLGAASRAERLADVNTLTPHEIRRWVYEVNDTAHAVEDTTLTELIERTMHSAPDATALVDGDRTISFRDLDQASATLARRLADAGVMRGDVVATAVPRSAEMIVALVAVLRAGAAYLPLDPAQPKARTEAVLRPARPRALIATDSVRGALPDTDVPLLLADAVFTDMRHDAGQPGEIHGRTLPDGAAYVIYTSGSTGEPKGVVVEHRAIVNRLEWMRQHYGFNATDRILQKTPTTFDVSVWELFLPLVTGATMVIAPPDAHKDPAALAGLVREHGVTTVHFVPSMLAVFLDEPGANGLELRRVFCSGEALAPALRDRFHESISADLHNLYGPTEAAVDVTFWNASRGDTSAPVPIGRPVWNTRLYVLDDRMRPLPPSVAGDLYIAGVQLARGYLGRDDLTTERFVPDPFGEAGSRMYHTGDLARWRPDGALEFLGRTDHQVKLRGQRIELGEIETVLASLPEVSHAAVVMHEPRSGDQRLVAYVTSVTGSAVPDPATLRDALAARLPAYMVPSAFVLLDELPLTSSGKLDRRALPEPAPDPGSGSRSPSAGTEAALAEVFAAALGVRVESIGADDDFFAMGGHSLLAARVAAHLRSSWGRDVGLGAIFARPTVARLAGMLDSPDVMHDATGSRELSALGLGPTIHLSHMADYGAPELFCVHPAGGISWCYAPLARALGAGVSVTGIQARGLGLGESIPGSLAEMAAEYVTLIRAQRPRGPYHLLGWSAGGIVVHEMAAQLQEQDQEVGVVALLDAYPSELWRDQPPPDEHAVLRALLHIAGQDPETLDGELTRPTVVAYLRRLGHPLGELHDDILSGVVRVVESSNRMVREHYHRRFDGPVLHFRAALDHDGDGLSPHQWEPYVSGLEVHDIPSLHAHMTSRDASARIALGLGGRL